MAYYFIGSSRDRQSRRAAYAQDQGQWDSPLPLASNAGEVAPVGDTTLSTRLAPAGYRRARDYTWEASGPPQYLTGEVAPMGRQVYDRPPVGRARSVDYTWLQWLELNVYGELPFGQQTTDNLAPRAYPRSRDYSFEYQAQLPNLVGTDATNAGKQTYDLPPRGPARMRDYSWESSAPPLYTAGEVAPVGVQSTDLPPRAYSHSRDYSFSETLFAPLIGADALVTGAQLTGNAPNGRPRASSLNDPGANFTVALQIAATAGNPVGLSTDLTALPPRAPARSRDYTYAETLFAGLIGADAMNAGQQIYDLPPRAPARQRDYTWLQWFELNVFAELPYGQSAEDLPPRAAARSRDYTFEQSIFPALIGTDALVTGLQLTGNAPRGYQRAEALADIGQNFTALLDFQTGAVPPAGKSTAATELAPRAYARSRDYTWQWDAELYVAGQDAMVTGDQTFDLPVPSRKRAANIYDQFVNTTPTLDALTNLPAGEQSLDLPPARAPRSRDYTNLNRLPNLIGQDATTAGKSTDATSLPPRGPARSRDYTWLQSLPLHVYQQLPTGQSTQVTEGPPRGPLRARDYTYLHPTDAQLIGQDRMYAAPGEVPTYDWQLPTPPRERMRDYTLLVRFDLPELAATTHPGKHALSDRALFIHGMSDRANFDHTLSDRAYFVHTDTESVPVG